MRLNRRSSAARDGNNGKRANAAQARLIRGERKQPFFRSSLLSGRGGTTRVETTRILNFDL